MSLRHGSDSRPTSPIPEIEESTEGLVFKCHLCEASFGDRGGVLAHLAGSHATEYESLVNKGALDAASDRSESADDDDRGKFPDHANRKVSKIMNYYTYNLNVKLKPSKQHACIKVMSVDDQTYLYNYDDYVMIYFKISRPEQQQCHFS